MAVDDARETDAAPAQSSARADGDEKVGTDAGSVVVDPTSSSANDDEKQSPDDEKQAPTDEQKSPMQQLSREGFLRRAVRSWRESLSALGGESALRDIDTLADATLDLSAAHPGGMASSSPGSPLRSRSSSASPVRSPPPAAAPARSSRRRLSTLVATGSLPRRRHSAS
ncbi:hypothetical protein [Salana multivorans]